MATKAAQSLSVFRALAEQLRTFQRPDPRTCPLFEENLDEVMRAVYAVRPQLSAEAALELMEVYACYCDTPCTEFELSEQECRGEGVEDHLQKLLEEMIQIASEEK